MLEPKTPRNPYRAAVNIHQNRLVDAFGLIYPKMSSLHINPQHLSELLSISDFSYRLISDPNFKLNLINHIQFCMTMKVVISKLLTEEATASFLQDLREKEAERYFREIDALGSEQLNLAHALVLLSQKEKDLILIAMLEERIHLANMIIGQLHLERDAWVARLQERKDKFIQQLDEPLNKVRFYKDLDPDNKLAIKNKIDKKLTKIEKRYSDLLQALEDNPDKQFTPEELGKLFGSFELSGERKVSKEYLENMRRLSKDQAVKKVIHEYVDNQGIVRPPAIEVDALAKEAVALHDAYMKDMLEINGKISQIDQQIKMEEAKRDECVKKLKEKLKKTDNPKKINKIKEEIKSFHSNLFEKLMQQKASLRAKVDEVRVIDEWLIHQHPQVFEAVFEQERQVLKTVEARRNLYPGQVVPPEVHVPFGVPLKEFHLNKPPGKNAPLNSPRKMSYHSDWAHKRLASKENTLQQHTKTIERPVDAPPIPPQREPVVPQPGLRKHAQLRQQGLSTTKQNLHSKTESNSGKRKPKKKE